MEQMNKRVPCILTEVEFATSFFCKVVTQLCEMVSLTAIQMIRCEPQLSFSHFSHGACDVAIIKFDLFYINIEKQKSNSASFCLSKKASFIQF